MDTLIQDLQAIEKANLTPQVKFTLQSMVSALNCLKEMSAIHGVPIDQITVEMMIREASPADVGIKKQNEWLKTTQR